jgi:hypothetical protein
LGTPTRMTSSLAGQADQRLLASRNATKKKTANSVIAAYRSICGSITRFVAASKARDAQFSNAVIRSGAISTKIINQSRFSASIVLPEASG